VHRHPPSVRTWWPLIPEPYLRTDRPNAITLLGIPLVVWLDKTTAATTIAGASNGPENAASSSSGRGTWRVFRDACPHRLAPLSEGRMEADGSLSCSYHGWRFDGSGACRRIPQAVDAAAEAAACASRRSCATTFPVRLEVRSALPQM
jgi:phenylpropionate dioxygenase-like ring-hydroxylating dioxygenase large terminal subunit